jgi:hypothetical protein
MEKKILIGMIKESMTQFAKDHDFVFYKPTILVRLSQDTLHIINFDVQSQGFDCSIAIQPLFVPSDSISLSFGNRLSHLGVHLPGIWGNGDEQGVISDLEEVQGLLLRNVLPWFEKVGYPKGMVQFLKDDNFEKNKELIVGLPPYKRRLYLALGNLYEQNFNLANSELANLKEMIKDETKAWINEIRRFAEQITKLIDTEDESQVALYLQNIIQNTKSNLKLKNK